MTMNFSYRLLLVFVIFNENVVDVTGRAHAIVDDWRNVIFMLRKGTTNIRWQTIFVACSGNGQSMLGAYKKVDYKSEITHHDCSSGHLRSSLINKWNSHKIDEVKIELIKGGDVVKVFVFDGTGSTNMNWFDKQRLVKSSYSDLSKSSTTNFFSIIGDKTVDRHFYINRNYHGCPNDKGWLMVVDTPVANYRPCKFDRLPRMKYPYIVYGPNNNVGHYQKTGQYEVADKLVISIKTFGTPLTSKWSTVVN